MDRYLSVNRFMSETGVRKENTYFQPKYILLFLICIAFVGLCIPAGIALNNTRDNTELNKACDPHLWRCLVAALCSPLCIVALAALLYATRFFTEDVLLVVYIIWWVSNGFVLMLLYLMKFVRLAPQNVNMCVYHMDLTAQPHLSDMGLVVGIFMPIAAFGYAGYIVSNRPPQSV